MAVDVKHKWRSTTGGYIAEHNQFELHVVYNNFGEWYWVILEYNGSRWVRVEGSGDYRSYPYYANPRSAKRAAVARVEQIEIDEETSQNGG